MDGSTQLTARLSRRDDDGQDENAEICTWHDRHALHDAMRDMLPPQADLTTAAGAVTITASTVANLYHTLQQRELGLPDPDRQATLIELGTALQDYPSAAFEYSWTSTDL